MMREVIVILLLASSVILRAQASLQDTPSNLNSAVQEIIRTLEATMTQLIVRGDWDEYASHLDSNYLQTRENGDMENKSQTLARLRDPKRKVIVKEMEPASLVIHTYPGTVICSAEFTVSVRDNGQVKTHRERQTDVFVNNDNHWDVAAEQNTTIGK